MNDPQQPAPTATPPADDPGISKEQRDYQHGEAAGETFILVRKDGRTVTVLEG